MQEFFRVGVFTNTHGIRGEIKVLPTTDDVSRFDWLKEIFFDNGKEKVFLEVERVRYQKNLVIVKFKGIDDINEIEKYKGMDLFVTRENALPLEEDEYYLADIMGAEIFTEDGEKFGDLLDILETGANLVFVTSHDGREVLLPVIKDCVRDVDTEKKRIVIRLLKGLMD